MRDLLVGYIKSLEVYSPAGWFITSKAQVSRLLFQLKKLESDLTRQLELEQVQNEIDKAIARYNTQYWYQKDPNYWKLLSSWQEQMKTLSDTYKLVLQMYYSGTDHGFDITGPEETRPLINLIIQLIYHPLFLFDINTLSLLKILENPKRLQNVLQYIARLPVAEPSMTAQQGTFAQFESEDADVIACKVLLNNVAQASQKNTPVWDLANGLIQTAGHLFVNLAMETIDLNKPDQPSFK